MEIDLSPMERGIIIAACDIFLVNHKAPIDKKFTDKVKLFCELLDSCDTMGTTLHVN